MRTKEEIEERRRELQKEYTNRFISVGNEPETIIVGEKIELLEWVLGIQHITIEETEIINKALEDPTFNEEVEKFKGTPSLDFALRCYFRKKYPYARQFNAEGINKLASEAVKRIEDEQE